MLVSTQVPDYLCSIRNASRCHGIPTVFVGSARDRIVPPNYQARIVKAYTGPKRIMRLRKANHSTPMNAIEQIRYRQELEWLRQRALGGVEACSPLRHRKIPRDIESNCCWTFSSTRPSSGLAYEKPASDVRTKQSYCTGYARLERTTRCGTRA